MSIRLFASCLFHWIIPDSNLVFFMSFYGLYNDNPKYISEYLHKKRPDVKIAWCIDEKRCNMDDIPSYVKVVKSRSVQKLIYQNRAKVLVDNMAGWYSMTIPKNRYRFYKVLKNNKVFNLSTWHGTPKKKIGVDAYDNDNKHNTFFSTSDIILDNSDYVRKIFLKCFQEQMPVYITGTPRNDILVNINNKIIRNLKKKFCIELGKKVVMYAPTYRNEASDSMHAKELDFMYGLDVDILTKSLSQRFGGEWIFIFRGHQFDQSKDDFNLFRKNMNIRIIDGNIYDDMAEYLVVSDVLITDYSGSMFDFMITNKPCFLYTPDKENYENSKRGVYEIVLPFKYNKTNKELRKTILEYDEGTYLYSIKSFIKDQGMREDGRAAERAVEIICEKLRMKKLK